MIFVGVAATFDFFYVVWDIIQRVNILRKQVWKNIAWAKVFKACGCNLNFGNNISEHTINVIILNINKI